jgi:AhpD family alkylhydroperoxidase
MHAACRNCIHHKKNRMASASYRNDIGTQQLEESDSLMNLVPAQPISVILSQTQRQFDRPSISAIALCESSSISIEGVMLPRLPYDTLAPDGLARMRELEHYLNTASGLEAVLLELTRLRASLMNGCEYCIHLHSKELRKLHEPEERIASVAQWRSSAAYTQRERSAFAWTEAVTNIQEEHAPDAIYDALRAHFNDVETVNLTLAITTINAWNRLAIALGSYPRNGLRQDPAGAAAVRS